MKKATIKQRRGNPPGTLSYFPAFTTDDVWTTNETSMWGICERGQPLNVFSLRTNESKDHGRLLATVVVNPEFDADTVTRFVDLFSEAATMFAMLRKITATMGPGDNAWWSVEDVISVLWGASREFPLTDNREQYVRENHRAVAALNPGEPIPEIIQSKGGGK